MVFDMVLYFLVAFSLFASGYLLGYSKGFLGKIKEYDNLIAYKEQVFEYQIRKLSLDNDNEGWKL